jgi:hypothetical protein
MRHIAIKVLVSLAVFALGYGAQRWPSVSRTVRL